MDVFYMKFQASIISPSGLQTDMTGLSMNSMQVVSPDSMLPFDDFLKKLAHFHEPTVTGAGGEIVALVENSNQPVFDFQELQVLHTKRLDDKEIAEAITSQGMDL